MMTTSKEPSFTIGIEEEYLLSIPRPGTSLVIRPQPSSRSAGNGSATRLRPSFCAPRSRLEQKSAPRFPKPQKSCVHYAVASVM
jgi:hypothetical protein